MCKRDTTDPLIRAFLDRYGLNLLKMPRERLAVGDVYVHDGSRMSAPGSVSYLLKPRPKLPEPRAGEQMADLEGVASSSVSTRIGIGFLDAFLTALGAGALVDTIKASLQRKGASALKFRFADARRDSVDPLALGTRIMRCKLVENHPLVAEGNRYYLVTTVARTRSISVIAEAEAESGVVVDLGAKELLDVSTEVNVASSGRGELTFAGERPLAFGVQLHELVFERAESRLKLRTTGAVPVMSGGRQGATLAPPALIGPADEVFVDLG